MSSGKTSVRRSAPALLASLALVALCAWGGRLAAQPELDTFLLQGARDIRYERVGPGMQGLLFSYDGSVEAQTVRLFAAMERRGWRAGMSPSREDCEGRCILGQACRACCSAMTARLRLKRYGCLPRWSGVAGGQACRRLEKIARAGASWARSHWSLYAGLCSTSYKRWRPSSSAALARIMCASCSGAACGCLGCVA